MTTSKRRESVKANVLAINALKAEAAKYEVAVKEHPGLVVTVYPTGARSFGYRYRQDGVLKRVPLPVSSFAEARTEWQKLSGGVRRGDDPAEQAKQAKADKQLKRQEQRSAPTIAELVDEYVALYAKRNKKSWRADELMLKSTVIPEWGGIKAKEIKRRDVLSLVERIAGDTPVRANRVLAVVRKMFNWAVDRDLLESSPCFGVKAPAKEASRDRYLSDAELRAFWNGLESSGLSADSQRAFRLQLLTGCRIGEIAGAEWSEIDLDKGEWMVPATRSKNGRANLVPLSSAALEIVATLDRSTPYLFPRAGKKAGHLRTDVATHEMGHAKFPGIKARFTSHDLRRTAATMMAALGIPRVVVDAIQNHKDRSIGAVYDRHQYAQEKRAALERLAHRIDDLAAGKEKSKVVPIKRASNE